MKIAFIGQKGINLGARGGGIEMHVQELAKQLAGRGHKITVYARKRYGLPKKLGKNIKVRFVFTIYRKNIETIIYSVLATFDALFRDYDIIHYHGVGPATLAWIPRLFSPRSKVVVTFHSQDRFHAKWSLPAKHYLHFGEWAASWFPHATISVSHVIQVYARKVFKRQVVYIPNGATVQHVRATNELKQFGLEKNKYILNVSRLVPHKGQHYLIKAFQEIKNKGSAKDFKLVLVGAPSYTPEYEDELKKMALGNPDILFLGYQTGDVLKQLFSHAYLYVQPSESEGLAVVVLEAMSFGTPVLVSDIPENLEAMHNAGFSFKNKNSKDLAKMIGELINYPALVKDTARKVKKVIEKNFNWELIAEKTEEVYRSIRH